MKKNLPFGDGLAKIVATGKTFAEIAVELDITPNYLSILKTGEKKGTPVPQKIMRRFNAKYALILKGKKVHSIQDVGTLFRDYVERSCRIEGGLIVLFEEIASMKSEQKKARGVVTSGRQELEDLTIRMTKEAARLLNEWKPLL